MTRQRFRLSMVMLALAALPTSSYAAIVSQMTVPIAGSSTFVPLGEPMCDGITVSVTGTVNVETIASPPLGQVEVHANLVQVRGTSSILDVVGYGAYEFIDAQLSSALTLESDFTFTDAAVDCSKVNCSNTPCELCCCVGTCGPMVSPFPVAISLSFDSMGHLTGASATPTIICSTGETNCSGACVDLATDPDNCGGCGNVCPSTTPACAGSMCRVP